MAGLMKGHTWKKHGHKMMFPCIAEIKYDEIRAQVLVQGLEVKFLSFAGKPLNNLGVYSQSFRDLCKLLMVKEIDCGVLVNNSFADTYRYVRSKTAPADLVGAKIQFLLFDVPESTRTYTVRRAHIDAAIAVLKNPLWKAPEYQLCQSVDGVEAMFRSAVAQGFEGVMVKSPDHKYERKRSYHWLKMKPEDTVDGVIVDIIQGTSIHGEPLDRAGSVTIKMPDDSTATPHGIPHELGREMLANPEKFIGEWAEFRYMERDRQGGYRHPVFVRLREEKE